MSFGQLKCQWNFWITLFVIVACRFAFLFVFIPAFGFTKSSKTYVYVSLLNLNSAAYPSND